MVQQQPASLQGRFLRPASIEIRCRNDKKYEADKAFYTTVFGAPVHLGEGACSFSVAQQDGKALELLLVQQGDFLDGNQTIVYWEVPGVTEDALRTVHEQVLAELSGASVREKPHEETRIRVTDHDPPYKSIIEDASGNYLGLVINPSIPLISPAVKTSAPRTTARYSPPLTEYSNYFMGGGALLGALVVGFIVGRLRWR